MGLTIAQKIIKAHLVSGEMTPGSEIALRIDQTLTQDATGTMAYLEFETMGVPRVKTELSVAYIDHNTLQSGFENADDHRFIQSMAKKYGLYFSRPGNGICHQVHLERFGKPGKTLIGSDSHTPTGGGIGMLAMGAGGLDVAVAMGGGAYYITMPKMYKVNLTGKLRDFVTAKDISLEILRILSVKGGVGAIIDFKRTKDGVPGTVATIEYDPNRSANIALIVYADGEKRYIIAPNKLVVGQKIVSGPDADIVVGNALPIANIPVGTIIHNIELKPGKGAQLARSAGNGAQLMAKEGDYAQVRLPSGEVRKISMRCRATIGEVGNGDHANIQIGKAGRKRHMGIRPTVRGSVMNPNDHPHGGGEGRAPVGRKSPVTPWGKPALGYKTRKKNKASNQYIVKRRNEK